MANFDVLMDDVNLFGEPYEEGLKKPSTADEKKKRRWEYAFQKWSDRNGAKALTHYGSCGFGVICDYCKNNSYGKPCVRALNEWLRERHKALDYDIVTEAAFEAAFDGEDFKGDELKDGNR